MPTVVKPVIKKTPVRKGVYHTIYGNAVEWKGGKTGFDLDMGERIPKELIDFTDFIRPL